MHTNLEGKVAIVTGGGRDIGRAAALKLAACGARVVVNYRVSATEAEETVRLIEQQGGQAIACAADVTSEEAVERLVQATRQTFGDEIHILVNNAGGIVGRKTLQEMDVAFWDEVMTLNLRTVFLVTRAVVPFMPPGSAVVNLASLAGRNGGGYGSTAYAATKGGILTFTRGLAVELSPNVRVNCVSPGLIDTTFHDRFTAPEARQAIAARTPLKREGTAEEVADAILFLASDASSFITGASVDINGGLYFA